MAYESINPYDEQVLKTFRDHTEEEVEQALATADQAFRTDWRDRSFDARAAVLKKAAALLRERRADHARTATLEMGKLLREALAEVDDAADILEYFAEHAAALLAPAEINTRKGAATVLSLPLGVISCIELWNYPYYQFARVAGPNLMAGNTVLVKHAPGVPQCALVFEDLLREAGTPAGVYGNLFVSNDQAERIIADHRVRGVALTGSERAGAAGWTLPATSVA